jgi:hypothetical protein
VTVEGFMAIAVVLGWVPTARVNDDATETDDW